MYIIYIYIYVLCSYTVRIYIRSYIYIYIFIYIYTLCIISPIAGHVPFGYGSHLGAYQKLIRLR